MHSFTGFQKILVLQIRYILIFGLKLLNFSWLITDEILDMMEERRKLKNHSEARYRELDRRIQRMCRVKKEEWVNARSREIEKKRKEELKSNDSTNKRVIGEEIDDQEHSNKKQDRRHLD